MSEEILAKIFYTSVPEPEKIRLIDIRDENNYKEIEEFIKKNTQRKRNPDLSNYDSSGIKSSIVDDILNKKLEVTVNDCKRLFEFFSGLLRTRSKESIRYWAVITTENFIFIYLFTPEKSFTFQEDKIVEFIKYLDRSTLLRFLFVSKKETIVNYIDSEKVDTNAFSDDQQLIYAYEVQPTKGFKELLAGEPVYESKGDLKVRIGYSESTDVVIESNVEDIHSIGSNIQIDFKRMRATVKIDDASIAEVEVAGKKYKVEENDVKLIINRMHYERLEIRNFLEELNWWRKKHSKEKVVEELHHVKIGDKIINKPSTRFNQKETIFIVGNTTTEYDNFINYITTMIRNNLSVSFIEASSFNQKYTVLNLGDFSLFFKIKEVEKAENLEHPLLKVIERVQSSEILYRIISYIALAAMVQYAHSKNFKEIVYQSAKKALNGLFSDLYKKTPVLELKEIDEVGIEFKAGIRKDREGFFDSSPKKLAKKIAEKSNSKDLNMILYFIGINEDTKDFSPIPLNRLRNEFHSQLKRHLKSEKWQTILSETIPLNNEDGILLIVLSRTEKGNKDV